MHYLDYHDQKRMQQQVSFCSCRLLDAELKLYLKVSAHWFLSKLHTTLLWYYWRNHTSFEKWKKKSEHNAAGGLPLLGSPPLTQRLYSEQHFRDCSEQMPHLKRSLTTLFWSKHGWMMMGVCTKNFWKHFVCGKSLRNAWKRDHFNHIV